MLITILIVALLITEKETFVTVALIEFLIELILSVHSGKYFFLLLHINFTIIIKFYVA